jgi:hypothetical protein
MRYAALAPDRVKHFFLCTMNLPSLMHDELTQGLCLLSFQVIAQRQPPQKCPEPSTTPLRSQVHDTHHAAHAPFSASNFF